MFISYKRYHTYINYHTIYHRFSKISDITHTLLNTYMRTYTQQIAYKYTYISLLYPPNIIIDIRTAA